MYCRVIPTYHIYLTLPVAWHLSCLLLLAQTMLLSWFLPSDCCIFLHYANLMNIIPFHIMSRKIVCKTYNLYFYILDYLHSWATSEWFVCNQVYVYIFWYIVQTPTVFLAATTQLNEWYFLSVCPSVTPFSLCSHHRIIMQFSGVIANDQGKVHAKGQGQRRKGKVTEVTTQLSGFRTVTPVWIHLWRWNYTYSLMLFRRGALLFFKVIRQISRSHGSKNCRIWPRLGVSGL